MQTQLNPHTRTHTETAAYWSLSDQSIDWKQASKQHKNWDTDDLLVNTISNDNSPSHIHTGHPVPRFGTLLHIQKHRQQLQTYTDTHTHKCRHSNWLIWNSEQGVLVCFWIMSGAGQLWMSLWRKKIQCGYLRERKTENKRENQAWQLGKTQAQSSKLCELHSSPPQVSTVPLLRYNGDLGSDKSHKIWTHKHLMKWFARAKLEPTNFSCLDQPSLVFGLWLDRPACLSRERTNCDTQCERRRQKSGEEDRKARS